MYSDKPGNSQIPLFIKLGKLPSGVVRRRVISVQLPLSHSGNTGSNPVGDAN
jgi:hypothetical protein